MKTNANCKKPAFLLVSILVVVLSTICIWLLDSNGGRTKIQRMTVPAGNGNSMSYVAFIPDNATVETPAPAFVIWPGRSSNCHQLDMWGVEMSRRGYVAITVDWNGNGETDILPTQDGYVTALMDSVLDMPYVDTQNIVVLGNSAGNSAATSACKLYADNVVAYVADVHPQLLTEQPPVNTLVIEAMSDQYVKHFIGDQEAVFAALTETWGLPETVVEGQLYGDAASGTLKQFVITPTIHHVSALNAAGMEATGSFLANFMPDTGANDVQGTILLWVQLLQVVAYAGIIMFVAAFGSWMYENVPFFHAIGNEETPNNGLRGAALTRNVVVAVAIPLITFFPVSWLFHNAEFLNGILPSRNLRGILGWLVTNAVITLIMTAVSSAKAKRSGHPKTAADYGFAGAGETLQLYKIGRAFILGALTVALVYSWVAFVEEIFGINYQVWNLLNISAIPGNRFFKAIPFTCMVFIILLAANIGMNTSRRLPDTGNATRDMARQITLNVLVSAGVITLLLILQYGVGWITGIYMMPQFENLGGGGTSSGALDFSFGFPLIMGFSAGISTYFFRKTHNIWIGLFTSTILAGFVGVVGSTFITSHAVM